MTLVVGAITAMTRGLEWALAEIRALDAVEHRCDRGGNAPPAMPPESSQAESDRIARTLATTLLPPKLPQLVGFESAAWIHAASTELGRRRLLRPVRRAGRMGGDHGRRTGQGRRSRGGHLTRSLCRSSCGPQPPRSGPCHDRRQRRPPRRRQRPMGHPGRHLWRDPIATLAAGEPGRSPEAPPSFPRWSCPPGSPQRTPRPLVRHAAVTSYPVDIGDTIVLFTDGLLEYDGLGHDDTLDSELSDLARHPARCIAETLQTRLTSWPVRHLDDVALLAISRVS